MVRYGNGMILQPPCISNPHIEELTRANPTPTPWGDPDMRICKHDQNHRGRVSEAVKKNLFFSVKPGEFQNHSVKIYMTKKLKKTGLKKWIWGDMMCLFFPCRRGYKHIFWLSHQMPWSKPEENRSKPVAPEYASVFKTHFKPPKKSRLVSLRWWPFRDG